MLAEGKLVMKKAVGSVSLVEGRTCCQCQHISLFYLALLFFISCAFGLFYFSEEMYSLLFYFRRNARESSVVGC